MRILLPFLLSAHCLFGSALAEFRPAQDWEWHVKPVAVNWSALATSSMLFRIERRGDEAIVVVIAAVDASLNGIEKYRPVVFDQQGGRHELSPETSVSGGGQSLRGFTIKPLELPNGKIDFLGVEKITTATLRDVIAPRALATLRAAGVEAFALPIVGQRYEFEVTSLDGKKIRSSDLRGKVVLLDFWAGWCAPCVAAIPALKRTYGELHDNGLEIVGINMDFKAEDARGLVAKHELPWPNVSAPGDDEQRALWEQAAGVSGIPRAVVLDRTGVVVTDLSGISPEQLADNLAARVAKSAVR